MFSLAVNSVRQEILDEVPSATPASEVTIQASGETDVHAGSLIDTLLFLVERLELAVPLSRPSATDLSQLAKQRATRLADEDWSDDDEGGV